jgi:hypothetical protein
MSGFSFDCQEGFYPMFLIDLQNRSFIKLPEAWKWRRACLRD